MDHNAPMSPSIPSTEQWKRDHEGHSLKALTTAANAFLGYACVSCGQMLLTHPERLSSEQYKTLYEMACKSIGAS